MSATDESPSYPDYFLSPDAVLKDEVTWRFGRAPEYTKTRQAWQKTKVMNHKAGSLEEMVENVVKNWEIEASYKPDVEQWRTINPKKYQLRVNGGPPSQAATMARIGTYNALIEPNKYYSPENMDFSSSHKTFKRMMPTFAWEVLDVYSGPPKVTFKWRHWGTFEGNYTAVNDQGQKVTLPSNGKTIDIRGMTVAELDEDLKVVELDIYFDPMEMFRQMETAGAKPEAGMAEAIATDKACPFKGQSV